MGLMGLSMDRPAAYLKRVSPRRDFVVAPIDDGVEFIAANDGPGSTCSPSGFVGPVVVIHSSRLP